MSCQRNRTTTSAFVGPDSILALNEAFQLAGVRRFGLVTPYLDEIQERILANYQGAGFECAAERHLGDPGNFSFSEVSEAKIAEIKAIERERIQEAVKKGEELASGIEAEAREWNRFPFLFAAQLGAARQTKE